MGFFGGKKTYVSSSVYNMAGEVAERPHYLKSLVIGNVISNTKFSISDTLQSGYINGPGIRARSFYRWALKNYEEIGLPKGNMGGYFSVNPEVLAEAIPHPVDTTVEFYGIELSGAEFSYWAEQWMFDNAPELMSSNWASDYDSETGELTITFEDLTTHTFIPDIDPDGAYLYATYVIVDLAGNYGLPHTFIYKIGSGNSTLDTVVIGQTAVGEYLPFIPIRRNSKMLSPNYQPEMWEKAQKAYKKATGGAKLQELKEKIRDNESIDDVDHAYVIFGVSLNILDKSCREYIYRFLRNLGQSQTNGNVEYLLYLNKLAAYDAATDAWIAWQAAQSVPSDPLYGTPAPARLSKPVAPDNRIRITSRGSFDAKLDIRIRWKTITETTGTGKKRAGAKKGDIWFGTGPHGGGGIDTIWGMNGFLSAIRPTISKVFMHWQHEDDEWRSLEIVGLVHENRIYDGKSVEIDAYEALSDSDESGFVLPIHYGTIREMSLVKSTQLMTQSTLLLFNAYQVVKTKWYQTGFFKLVVFIAIIAISIVFPPAAGAGAGILGSGAAVGAALGFSGLVGIIIGAAVNAIAGMIVGMIISRVSVAIFGDKIGAIIGAVVAMVTMQVGSALANGQSLTAIWGNLMSAANIIQMTSAVGNGVAGYIRGSAAEYAAKTQETIEEYEKQAQRISQQYLETFGYANGVLDPTMLTESNFSNFMESEGQFLARTLMTGSDIAEMSMDMITNFADYTLTVGQPL